MCTGPALSDFTAVCSPDSCNPVCGCLKDPPKSIFGLKYLAEGSRHVADSVLSCHYGSGIMLVLTTQSQTKGHMGLLLFFSGSIGNI